MVNSTNASWRIFLVNHQEPSRIARTHGFGAGEWLETLSEGRVSGTTSSGCVGVWPRASISSRHESWNLPLLCWILSWRLDSAAASALPHVGLHYASTKLSTYVCTCKHVGVRMCVCCACKRICDARVCGWCGCVPVCVKVCMCQKHWCVFVCVSARACVHVYVCVCACAFVFMHMHAAMNEQCMHVWLESPYV